MKDESLVECSKEEVSFFWCLVLCLYLFCVVIRAKRTCGMSAVIGYKFNHILLTHVWSCVWS